MLRLDIDGSWEPEDFIEVLKGIESLYYKSVIRSPGMYGPFYWLEMREYAGSFDQSVARTNEWLLSRARTISRQERRLSISRIQYASPGGIDLVGIGKATEAVAGVVDRLIKFFTERELRRQADRQAQIETAIREVGLEREQESLRSLKIANARAILELHRDYPDMPDEVLVALVSDDQDRLIPRIAERKLIGAKTINLGRSEKV
jgi:hypothetical protein